MDDFEQVHKERDHKLPENRRNLLNTIEEDLLNDSNVLAVFYGGSIGSGNTDLYSDIDLRVVVEDHVIEEYLLNKKERAKNWGSVLFFEDFPEAPYTIAHFDTFIKVDAFYYRKEDIRRYQTFYMA
ncbi:nucleotidyltransferase domain-containing protein [Jeotgalibacillus proteolyticus]|uniref:nucleotidyltransferase domain-containing protein n=1 Tax=Jeotgalibacillus proteolyticus TaxID=2082395 RepID=UPI001FD67791|nr:nucleotidyltransferase domain-containing protein [Jeotgalibacillus proteolyticus]